MKIKLNDNYTLVSDSLNVYIVETGERKKEPTGGRERRSETVERVFGGFHGNLQLCLKSFLKHSINQSEAETLEGLIADIEKIENRIEEFCVNFEAEFKALRREASKRQR